MIVFQLILQNDFSKILAHHEHVVNYAIHSSAGMFRVKSLKAVVDSLLVYVELVYIWAYGANSSWDSRVQTTRICFESAIQYI